MTEIWKDVIVDKEEKDKYIGLYQVSNLGNVKRINKKGKFKILKPQNHGDGYNSVRLSKNGNSKNYKIHRLVALTFIPNQNNKKYIDHKDTNKQNNNVDNLRWVTNVENMNNELTKIKISNSMSKKIYQYDLKFNLIKIWNSGQELIKNGFYNISKCCTGERKTAYKYIWKYELI